MPEQAKQIAQLEPWIKNEFQRQFEQLKLIDSKPRFQINEIHKTVHDDAGLGRLSTSCLELIFICNI